MNATTELQVGLAPFANLDAGFYQHPINNILVSHGVNHLFHNGGRWLVDLIFSCQAKEVKEEYGLQNYQVWKLAFEEGQGTLRIFSENDEEKLTHILDPKPVTTIDLFALETVLDDGDAIEFPIDQLDLYFIENTLMLAAEFFGDRLKRYGLEDMQCEALSDEQAQETIKDAQSILEFLNTSQAKEDYIAIKSDGDSIVIFEPYTQRTFLIGEIETNKVLFQNTDTGIYHEIGQHAQALGVSGTSSFKAA